MQKFCIWASLVSGLYFAGYVAMYRLGWLGYGPAETGLDFLLVLTLIAPLAMAAVDIVVVVVLLLRKDWQASRTVLGALGLLIAFYIAAVIIGLPTA